MPLSFVNEGQRLLDSCGIKSLSSLAPHWFAHMVSPHWNLPQLNVEMELHLGTMQWADGILLRFFSLMANSWVFMCNHIWETILFNYNHRWCSI